MEHEERDYQGLRKVLNFVQGAVGWVMISVWFSGSILTFAILCTINIVISFVITVALKENSGKGWWREAVEGGMLLLVAILGTTLVGNQSGLGLSAMCPDWYIAVAIVVIWINHGHLLGWILRHVGMLLMFLGRFTDWGSGRTARPIGILAMAALSGTGEAILVAYDEASSAKGGEAEAVGA